MARRKQAGALLIGLGAGLTVAGALAALVPRRARASVVDGPAAPRGIGGGLLRSGSPVWTSTLPARPGRPVHPRDLEAMARVIESELGSGSLAERLVIAYTTRNRAQAERRTLYQLEAPAGQWGAQGEGRPARPFASGSRPSARARTLAAWVLAHPEGLGPVGSRTEAERLAELATADPQALEPALGDALQLFDWPDPSGGAWAFWEPALQDELVRRGSLYRAAGGKRSDESPQGGRPELWRFRAYRRPAAEVRAQWQRGGQRVLGQVGRIELWSAPGR